VPPGCHQHTQWISGAGQKGKIASLSALGGFAPAAGAPRLPAHTGGVGRSGIGPPYPRSCDEGGRPMLITNHDTVWSRVREPA
jgi:hypothetical protein